MVVGFPAEVRIPNLEDRKDMHYRWNRCVWSDVLTKPYKVARWLVGFRCKFN